MMDGLNMNMRLVLREAKANGGLVSPGPTRAALIRRGLVYQMDHPQLAGHLTFEGERVAEEELPATPAEPQMRALPDTIGEPQEPPMAPGELMYAAMDPETAGRWYRLPWFGGWEAVPTAEIERLREVLVETLTAVELVLDERGYFQAPKRYIPIKLENEV